MTRSFHISLFEGTLHVDKIHGWIKMANITHVLLVPVFRQPISHHSRPQCLRVWESLSSTGAEELWVEIDFPPERVDVSRLHDTVANLVPEWNSRPGAKTGVNSRRGDSHRHDILWWYHVNKCRAMRGNRNELAPVSCKHPLIFDQQKLCSSSGIDRGNWRRERWSCYGFRRKEQTQESELSYKGNDVFVFNPVLFPLVWYHYR